MIKNDQSFLSIAFNGPLLKEKDIEDINYINHLICVIQIELK